jgi:hypothetical protein
MAQAPMVRLSLVYNLHKTSDLATTIHAHPGPRGPHGAIAPRPAAEVSEAGAGSVSCRKVKKFSQVSML